MNHKLTIVAALAWAGAFISSAQAASAIAVTTQSGAYASCSNNWSNVTVPHDCIADGWFPYQFSTQYQQQIRLVQTACDTGGCNDDVDYVYTTNVYSTGRKLASPQSMVCGGYSSVYEFGGCAC